MCRSVQSSMSVQPVGSRYSKAVRIFPNGECVIWRQRVRTSFPVGSSEYSEKALYALACWQLYCRDRETLKAAHLFMGLSLVSNFDRLANRPPSKAEVEAKEAEENALWFFDQPSEDVAPAPPTKRRYGLNGIPRKAARIVRNAAYLLQKNARRENLTFATVTVPTMPVEDMAVLHENWHKAVEIYRLGLKRRLQDAGLSGESVGVSEIQEERCNKTGLPVLHLHTVFQGRVPYGPWIISTKCHDELWRNAVKTVLPKALISFKSAANLQVVKTSAANYLGKYISKGVISVSAVKDAGMSDWLPRQWWNCTRSLSARVRAETIRADYVAEALIRACERNNESIWHFWGEVLIDIGEKQGYWLATYGRLTTSAQETIREFTRYPKTTVAGLS